MRVELEPGPRGASLQRQPTPVGTLWTLTHETEGIVTLNVGPHPHGYELRLILNNRFLRSRVHREFSGVLEDSNDTRARFEELGFEESTTFVVH